MNNFQYVDCACLIHGDRYPIEYVTKLYNMLVRSFSIPVRFHVYTESHRNIPSNFIKHELIDWGFGGARSSWWYKLQLFNPAHHNGTMIYFDLDTVIANSLDWMLLLPTDSYLWAVRDFKYLWRPGSRTINSSVMMWDTTQHENIWSEITKSNIDRLRGQFFGDQDYINELVKQPTLKFFDERKVLSWRWQALDGGYCFKTRKYLAPYSGTKVDYDASILIFHGDPKPDDVSDPYILERWV